MKSSLFLPFITAVGLSALAAEEPMSDPAKPAIPAVVESIRSETVRSVEGGRPLPLLGTWNTGTFHHTWPNRPRGSDPRWQLEQIEKGVRFLPTFALPEYNFDGKRYADYLFPPFEKVSAYGLPFVLLSTQWERLLTALDEYRDLPPEQNPNVVTPEGEILDRVDPFGPTQLWYEVGRRWTDHAAMARLQEIYPDPPKIIFLSNNEHTKLSWHEVEKSRRYLDKYGPGRPDAFKRKVVGDAWIEKYRELQRGLRDGLTSPAWKEKAIFIGYGGDVGMEALGRWGGWTKYSLHTPGRVSLAPYMWDGVSPSYYMHNWSSVSDYQVHSNQIEAMNGVFALEEAYKINPDFWYELSLWDGDSPNKKTNSKAKLTVFREAGQVYDMERYRGWLQYGMWLMRPRVMRLYENWITPIEEFSHKFENIHAIVEPIHRNATLAAYWRKGELVLNPAARHPYQEGLPNDIAIQPRWFLLDTSVMPERPWKLETEIPVFSLALRLGEAPNRSWLLYAHAPLRAYDDITITIPDWKEVKVNVPREGAFYEIRESDDSIHLISTSISL